MELRKQKTIIYLQIPQEQLKTFRFLLNMFYTQFFEFCARGGKVKNGLPIYCLLDEAGHMNIPELATTMTTIRKYKVSLLLALQSLTQLESAY